MARSLADGDPDAVARLRALVSTEGSPPPALASPEAVARDVLQRSVEGRPRPIGIWQPRGSGDDLVFERDPGALAGEWWADAPVLRPKRSLLPLRVCLLGESTAAGWFYAPDLTPARVLEEQLRRWAGERTFEVVDLCMVNLQASALVELLGSALQLAPDIIVVFAGNNWPVGLPVHPKARPREREAAAIAFAAEGFAGLARLCTERTREQAERTLETLARIADGASVPLVLVAPESNLVDWHRDRPVPWLSGGGTQAWHEDHRRARSALAGGRLAEAQAAATSMLERDGGVCATSWRLLGEALLRQDRPGAAREAFERALEARAWDNHPSTPSTTRPVRDALARAAREYALPFVDLREVFAAHAGPEPPGRRLFLDYCHLTAEGIRIAMAAVAVRVLVLTDPPRAPREVAEVLARADAAGPDAETEARARFLSALYGAHYGSGYDPEAGSFLGGPSPPVRYWLETALEKAPGIADTVRAWVGTRVAPPSALPLSLAQQQFLARLGALERQSALGAGLDPELVEEACALLQRRGVPMGEELGGAWARTPGRPVELVNPHYLWAVADSRGQEAGLGLEGHAYHRARWGASHFCLPLRAPNALRLHCTARLPSPVERRKGTVRLLVNGEAAGGLDLDDRWQRGIVHVSRGLLRAGYNRITLRWPALPEVGDLALQEIRRRLHEGLPADLHPVFGEVFSLRAQPLE